MKENKTMMDLAESSFRKLVVPFIKHADDLEVNVFEQNGAIVIQPRAHFADTGKIIGKKRSKFLAVQAILTQIGFRNGVNIRLDNVQSPKVGGPEFITPFDPQMDWHEQETMGDLKEVLGLILLHPFMLKVNDEIIDGEEWTKYTFEISKKEKLLVSEAQIARDLSNIFHAIGRERGRLIKIESKTNYAEKIAC